MFRSIERRRIDEIKSDVTLYLHEPTGAQLLSVENDDENKVFGITFRTPPADSTGVAHILEHSVLCGSRKFPVKEPFVELLKGSLQTFLNAFTYPDKTCYPVASQNAQDFYNLIEVYMDAVLYPLLTRHTHAQEAWHYELENPGDPLSFKGVVFNEMKGVYSSPDSALAQYGQETLFPDITYGLDYGGRPAHIPDLTYEQLCDFHQRYYHPSNARIWFYGDDDPAQRLKIMEQWLKPFDRHEVNSEIPLQPPFAEPRTATRLFQGGADAQAMSVTSWLLGETTDVAASLSWEILSYILIGSPSSPLRKALIDSGLGEDVAGVGLENQLRQMYFSTGLKGIDAGDVQEVAPLIESTLKKIVADGLDPRTVSAALNTVEFRLRENNTGHYPRGLSLMVRCLGAWLYEGNPFAPLSFAEPLLGIESLAYHGYFEQMIRTQLLENPHRCVLLLKPGEQVAAQEEKVEKERLASARAAMSPGQLAELVENTKELKRLQVQPDPPGELAKIPRLGLGDLPEKVKTIPCRELSIGGVTTLFHPLSTNGIVYFDIGFDLNVVPDHLLPYVGLLGRVLLEMGTETEDFVALDQRIGTETGGIESDTLLLTHVDGRQPVTWFFIRGKAIIGNAGALAGILSDVFTRPRLDNPDRFKQIVLEEKAELEAELVPSGHSVVNTRLRSLFTVSDAIDEATDGLEFLFFIRQLAERVDRDWPGVLKDLAELHRLLIQRRAAVCQFTADEAGFESIHAAIEGLVADLPDAPVSRSAPRHARPRSAPEGLAVPSQVNYVGMAASLFDIGYAYDGSAQVIARHLRNSYLWERVRVQGGAYGGMCWLDARSGVLSFVSYRDPNLNKTLDAYRAIAGYLKELTLTDDELTKGIVGAIGDQDQHQLPDAKGYTSLMRHLSGDTDQRRQRIREQILGTTLQDFHNFGAVMDSFASAAAIIALGSEDAITAAGELTLNKVL